MAHGDDRGPGAVVWLTVDGNDAKDWFHGPDHSSSDHQSHPSFPLGPVTLTSRASRSHSLPKATGYPTDTLQNQAPDYAAPLSHLEPRLCRLTFTSYNLDPRNVDLTSKRDDPLDPVRPARLGGSHAYSAPSQLLTRVSYVAHTTA